MKKELRH